MKNLRIILIVVSVKTNHKKVNFFSQFCLGSIYEKIDYVESNQVSSQGNVREFSVNFMLLMINLKFWI